MLAGAVEDDHLSISTGISTTTFAFELRPGEWLTFLTIAIREQNLELATSRLGALFTGFISLGVNWAIETGAIFEELLSRITYGRSTFVALVSYYPCVWGTVLARAVFQLHLPVIAIRFLITFKGFSFT